MNKVYLLLGSNTGDREEILKRAVLKIENSIGRVVKKSAVYETAAWSDSAIVGESAIKENENQNDFLNLAVSVDTNLLPLQLLEEAMSIEKVLGRIRTGKKWESRIIDIDILFYNELVIDQNHLKIPHPFIHIRRFTLEPMVEIAPDFVHPIFRKTISELLAICPDKLRVAKRGVKSSLFDSSIFKNEEENILQRGAEGIENIQSGEKYPLNFIAIEGNIGSGKTSLAEKMAKRLNARLMLEQFADNPFLPKFYSDREKFAFPLEMSFLAERYSQVKEELSSRDLFHPLLVSDYLISKCLVFSKINLQSDEYALYTKLFNIIYPTLPKPDLLVYLYRTTEQLLENINKRGRNYEQGISSQYLQNIQDGYFEFLRQQPDLRILIIDTSKIDFVNNEEDFEKIMQILKRPYKRGFNRILL